MKTLLPDKTGGHFFSPTNRPLVMLLRNLGVKHLRLGGTTVESPPRLPIPGPADIDELFALARAAQVEKVIYSLRLLETNCDLGYAATNATLARYIWHHYQPWLDCFAIGNEPDRRTIYAQDCAITNFSSYLGKWRRFAAAVTSNVPEARFSGPDAGSGNIYWTTHFAQAEKASGLLRLVTEHFYVGGAGKGVLARDGLDAMLSPDWSAANERLFERMAVPVMAGGLAYGFTEANDHYSGGVPGASDTFAGALWALDFLHWWAAHGARGVDFHNTQWVVNDVVTQDADHQLAVTPKAYGLKAFSLGSDGRVAPLKLTKAANLNLTAYAVRNDATLYVTLINKEHGEGARSAAITIVPGGLPSGRAEAMFLTAGDIASRANVSLGGASLSSDVPWRGRWTVLDSPNSKHYTITLSAASAAVVRIHQASSE